VSALQKEHLDLTEEVRAARDAARPVVVLESTIVAHGFPYPANLECAREAERIAREGGAVPATVAILGGRIKLGLSDAELEHLATAPEIAKASRRDIPVLVARGGDGATTVAGTMAVAAMAGVRLFATGGIGGAHRGAQQTFDVSADILELARSEVAVVCAGAKSILDIGLTLELLETHGVPVIGYGTDEFPAFYTRSSGHGVDVRVDTPEEVANVLRTKRELSMRGGSVIANPIPAEYELDPGELDRVVETVLAEADAEGVHGRDITPFLLARIHELTDGESERANKELVYANVRLAARVANVL
jgi:pseudouridine-5'-phosphate glycosidase